MSRFVNRRDAECIPSQTASAAKPNDVPRHLAIVARAGCASRGMVYVIVGALTTAAALWAPGGRTTGAKGALIELSWQPFGYALVAVLARSDCAALPRGACFRPSTTPTGTGGP